MLHIYRQITGLRRVQSIVIAQKRENPDKFPFDKIDIVAKPATHFLRRFWFRQVRNKPWQISSKELRALTDVLNREKAQLLHTFFGHIVVHLLRSEEHTSELQSLTNLVCRLLLEKKKHIIKKCNK